MPIKIVPKEDKKTYAGITDYVRVSCDKQFYPKKVKKLEVKKKIGWRFSKVFSLQAG
jgi:ribosomal protein L14